MKKFEYKNLSLKGVSQAGTGTSFIVPQLKLCFDTAQGWPFAFSMKQFLITHGHMDHAGGIPYIVSQRALMNLPIAPMYMPEELLEPMTKILNTWKSIEGFDYQYDLRPAIVGDTYEINKEYFFKPFRTKHRVTSLGYTVFHKKKCLKPQYKGLATAEVRQRITAGEELQEWQHAPVLSFTGDTEIEFLDMHPEVAESQLLLMECTYFDESRPVERAKKWGHIHFDEVLERLPSIKSEKILLTHNSSSYKKEQIAEILNKKLSQEDKSRVVLF